MRRRDYYIIYAILVLVFSVIIVASFSFGKELEELDSRIDQLESDIKLHKLSTIGTRDLIASYKLETSNLEYMINEQSKQIKESTNEIEDSSKEYDLRLMAQLIEAESGNQPFEGKLAVGTVVMNRIQSDKFPDTIKEVVFQKGQFQVVDNGTIYNTPSEDSMKAAKEIMDGKRVLASNVLYFYNPKITSLGNWIRKLKVDKVIKDHTFVV